MKRLRLDHPGSGSAPTRCGLAALVIACALVCGTALADPSPILSRPVPEFVALDRPAEQAAVYLARVGAFRLGFECADAAVYPRPSVRRIRLEMRDTNVRAVLDAITEADPRYIWRLNGEFVNIMPKEAAADPDYYMNARVERFEAKDVPLADAADTLLELPSISRHNPSFWAWKAGYRPTGEMNPKVTITANDATWRALMNALAREFPGCVGWTARPFASPAQGGETRKAVDLMFSDSSRVALPWEYPRPAMVPLRAAMEELGAAVHWLPEERGVVMRWGDTSLRVWVGSTLFAFCTSEGPQEWNLAATTELRDGRVWVSEGLVRDARGIVRHQELPGRPAAPKRKPTG